MRFIMYHNDLWESPAYQKLTIPARNLFHFMLNERQWRGKGKKRICTNTNGIKLNRQQFIKQYGYSITTVTRARNLLIFVGFMRLVKQGGNCRGDMNVYSLEIDIWNPRWKRFPKETWEDEIPKAPNKTLGKRWEKGQSGNPKYQTNYSLSNDTHNTSLLSTRITPKDSISAYNDRLLNSVNNEVCD